MLKANTPPRWDLSDFYASIEDRAIRDDVEHAKQQAAEFAGLYKGKLVDADKAHLLQAINDYEKLEDLLGKLSSYAYLIYAGDQSDENGLRFYQQISEEVNSISTKLLFFALELNAIDDKRLEELLADGELQRYQPFFRDVRVFKEFQLSEEVEAVLHEKAITSRQAWVRLFDETQAAMRFELNDEQVTIAEVSDQLSDHDPKKREAAGRAMGEGLAKHIKLNTTITNILAKDKAIEDDFRGYPLPISSRNKVNFIEDEVVDALLSTVRDNYKNLSHRYYAMKAKWLGVEALNDWDRNAPLPEEPNERLTWEEGKETVLAAYEAFSPEMARLGEPFFDKFWIDAEVREGKDSGAFSHPTVPSVHPYILMNYQGKLRDVMTLAHELGHGIHQCLSAEQGALMADTPLTLAETASVFGEMLTFQSLLKKQDEKTKKALIASKVEDMLHTVVRQVAFCTFEERVHNKRLLGELSSDELGEIWLSVQQESLGDSIKFHDNYKHFWSYIPHFIHSPFYVYAYAFGDCLVNSLYAVYQEGLPDFEAKYIEMLQAGGTKWHKELLEPFGLSAADPDFWQKGLSMIEGYIDELEGIDNAS